MQSKSEYRAAWDIVKKEGASEIVTQFKKRIK